MKKKFTILICGIFSMNLLILITGGGCCSYTTCTYPAAASIVAFDNADSIRHEPNQTGVLAKALMLEYRIIDSERTCMRKPPIFDINAAYATTCAHTEIPLATIDSILLVSNHDFDNDHPAGTDLKDLFAKPDSVKPYYYSYLNRFYLMHSPTDTGTHIFTITFFTNNPNITVTASTLPIKLLL